MGSIAFTVALEGDSDNDGLPDDYETLNAVNPGGSNLALLPGVVVSSSSFLAGSPPELAIDGNLQTSWFTDTGDAANQGASPFLEVTLPADADLSQIRLLGNRQPANGRDFFAGIFQAFDAGGTELFNSGPLPILSLNRDIGVPLDLDDVRRVRFTSTSDEGSTPGLSEIQLISRPGGTGLDPSNPGDAVLDFDQDTLTNLDEFNQGTSPFLADTDSDGLLDAEEIGIGSNPTLPDSDLDGLLDGSETSPSSDADGDGLINVLDPDSDNDGLPDGVEFALAGTSTGANPNADDDGDGLLNLDEVDINTDPSSPDTDGDNFSDLEEVLAGTDPLDPDSDGDGLVDGLEAGLGSDPLDPSSLPNTNSTFGNSVSATLAILNLVDPGEPGGTDPIEEAVSPTLALLNVVDPGEPGGSDPIVEAVSPTLALLNVVDPGEPGGTDPIAEAVSPTLALLNVVDPGEPGGSNPIDEAVSPTLALLNVVDPGEPGGSDPIDEVVSPTVALLNLVDAAGPFGEAVSPMLSMLVGSRTVSTDLDGDGLSDLYEVSNGLDPTDPSDADRDPDGDGLSNREEELHGTDPRNPDTDADGLADGDEVALGEEPLSRESTKPRVAITAPDAESVLLEGETLTIAVEATDNVRVDAVEIAANGLVFATVETPPYELVFTVPMGLESLAFSAVARDAAGNSAAGEPVEVSVVPDPLTTVQGRIVDAQDQPVAGAAVEVYLQGLRAELYDLGGPEAADLDTLEPMVTTSISAINFRNPEGLLAGTAPGTALRPDFAAWFSGLLEVPAAGLHTFVLGGSGEATLSLDGEVVLSLHGDGAFHESSVTLDLPAGFLPILVETTHRAEELELQLSHQPPGGRRRVLSTEAFLQEQPAFHGTTAADGGFAIEGVPANLGWILVVAAESTPGGERVLYSSEPRLPVPAGITDFGRLSESAEPVSKFFASNPQDP